MNVKYRRLLGRSTVWQATTVQRMKARWGDQMDCTAPRLHKLRHPACARPLRQASGGALQKARTGIGLAGGLGCDLQDKK